MHIEINFFLNLNKYYHYKHNFMFLGFKNKVSLFYTTFPNTYSM